LVTLALIIAGAVIAWRSGNAVPGGLLIVFGLAINVIMAASRRLRPSAGAGKR
jgi:hypothetical protein